MVAMIDMVNMNVDFMDDLNLNKLTNRKWKSGKYVHLLTKEEKTK